MSSKFSALPHTAAAGHDDRGLLEADDARVLADHVDDLGQKAAGA